MPLRYDPDTGMPSYEPAFDPDDLELTEGVTPKVKTITMDTKRGVFQGDRSPFHRRRLGKTPTSKTPLADAIAEGRPITEEVVDQIAATAKPARLNAEIASDEEVDRVERLAAERAIQHWPIMLRLINRLRRAER